MKRDLTSPAPLQKTLCSRCDVKVARLTACNHPRVRPSEDGSEPHAWETSQVKAITRYVGLDVHKSTISVAIAEEGRGGEVRHHGVVENRADILARLAERLGRRGERLRFCYEAGPCGYGLHRLLSRLGHDCA